MLTTTEAARELGLAPVTVKRHCQRGVIRAERHGRDWLISRAEVERYKVERRGRGRPKKGPKNGERFQNKSQARTAQNKGEPL